MATIFPILLHAALASVSFAGACQPAAEAQLRDELIPRREELRGLSERTGGEVVDLAGIYYFAHKYEFARLQRNGSHEFYLMNAAFGRWGYQVLLAVRLNGCVIEKRSLVQED